MTDGDGKQRPANDNHAPDGKEATNGDASKRLDTVVLSIARLIGRHLAREQFERAMRPANDNGPPPSEEPNDGNS